MNAQGRNDALPQMKRGIEELEESARKSDAKSRDFVGGDAKAYRLLNQNANIDAESLTKEIVSMDFKARSEPLQPLEGTDIEGYLTHHHDMIFLSVIDEARKKTEMDVRATQMRWEKEEWETSRKDFMDSLGHRALAWEGCSHSAVVSPSAQPKIMNAVTDTPSNGSDFPQEIMPQATQVNAIGSSWFGSIFGGPAKGRTDAAALSSSVASVLDDCKAKESMQHPLLRDHCKATKDLHLLDQSESHLNDSSHTAAPSPCSDYLTSLPGFASEAIKQYDFYSDNDLKGYRFLLTLISAMTGEGAMGPSGKNKPGYFSPVVVDSPNLSSTREKSERREHLSEGAKSHLESDFRTNVILPESAAYSRNVTGSFKSRDLEGGLEPVPSHSKHDSTLISEVQRYVSAVLPASSHSHSYNAEVDEHGVLLWPQVYYCIRIGALSQARDLLRKDEVNYNYFCAIDGLLQLESNESDAFSATDILTYIVKCKAEYNETINYEFGQNSQGGALLDAESDASEVHFQYKMQVLNLLGLVNLDALCAGEHLRDTTIQDFLWVNLWFRHWSHILEEKIPSKHGTVLPTVVNESDIFYRVMDAGGADDFDPDGGLCFEFAMILCCCHQFGGAVEHLFRQGRIFAAVHILVCCLHYGLVIPYLPLAMPMQTSRSTTPKDLLLAWVNSSRVSLSVKQKVDYLAALDSLWVNNNPRRTDIQSFKSDEVRTDAFCRLLCEARDDEVLLLTVDYRLEASEGAYLKQYMTSDKLCKLLVHAAGHLSSTGSHIQRVIKFHELAGGYVEVLEVLNKQLAKVILPAPASSSIPTTQRGGRDYWLQFVKEFNQKHFEGDSAGAVVRTLNAAGRTDLMSTFNLLLKLESFFSLHHNRKFDEAKTFLSRMRFLPSTDDEKMAKVQEFLSMDSPVRSLMDDILLAYMECIFELFHEKRRDRANYSFHQNAMRSLQFEAGVLVAFGGQLQRRFNRTDTASRLMDYHNRMVSEGY